nr:PadR family transcriptional regulator [Crocosphaera watsonii]
MNNHPFTLSLLAEKPQHGYQLIKEIENRWGGFYRPSPGSVYPTLQQLEERNYLTSQEVEGKKVYSITDSGEQLLAQQPSSAETLNKSEEQPKLIELKMTLRDLQEVIMQVTRSDKSKNIDKVLSSLKKLKKEIYLMLANEED